MIFYLDPNDIFNKCNNEEKHLNISISLNSGGTVYAQHIEGNKLKILSIESTNPMDFLHPDYQPGNTIDLFR